MTSVDAERKSLIQKSLQIVERIGNSVPHPAVLFAALILLVVVLSSLLAAFGAGVTHQRLDPATDEIEMVRTEVRSLLSADGLRFIFTSVVPNFINFGPVGIILVAMIGVGLAERAGLIQALIRKIVAVAPRMLMTAIVVTMGVLSSIASDAGYLVLIPLGAAAFLSLGRHPFAGLAAAFAGVAAAFGVNFLVKPIDGILAEMTVDAAHLVDPDYFGVASSLLLILVCTVVTERVVEPRLGKYEGESPDEPPGEDDFERTKAENRGLLYAAGAFALFVLAIGLLALPSGAPLRNAETGDLIGDSPFMHSLVFLIMLAFFAAGAAYGAGSGTLRSVRDGISAIEKTFADLGALLFLFFVISQFVAYFNFSNIGSALAVTLANRLQESDLSVEWLLLSFILIGFLLCFPLPNILPKWAIMAPIFVPLFMKLGIDPDVVLAAYRVSDSPPNVINPLLPHFALVVGFAQRYDKSAGVGTIIALMLPYTIATGIAWTLAFFAWHLLKLPFGPG